MAETVHVELKTRGYDILVGERLLSEAGKHIAPLLLSPRVIIITDQQVGKLYLHRLTNALSEENISARAVVLPPGETTKSFTHFEQVVENILELKPDRSTMLVALGGGVIGDITGFAASVVLRGIDFIQIPTTLLAQVDSSVGGKTAINSRFGKNLVGTFHQPRLVLSDVSALSTLPKRELLAGYAEVIKYGLINNLPFFSWLEHNALRMLSGDVALLTQAIAESCRAKAAIVAEDETEQGDRALLNLGHTFAHAFEAETGYSEALLHGEAVALGMVLALALSKELGLCDDTPLTQTLRHFEAVGLPVTPRALRPHWNIDALMDHFNRDKKARHGALTFILCRDIGQAFIARDVDPQSVRRVLAHYCE